MPYLLNMQVRHFVYEIFGFVTDLYSGRRRAAIRIKIRSFSVRMRSEL